MRLLALTAAFFFCLTAGLAAPEKRIALVIGNAAYEHAGQLRNPGNDAADMKAALERLGFTVTLAENVNARGFGPLVANFTAKARGADVALFFYAGHALQFDRQSFLMPSDAKLETEFDVRRETFAAQEIVSALENAARASIVILDSCRDNPLAKRLKDQLEARGRSGALGRGMAPVRTSGGAMLVVYAAAPDEQADDGRGRNSPFTASLLKHIETPGLEVEQMLKRVTAEVKTETGGRQNPQRLSELDFEVWLKAAAPAAPKREEAARGDQPQPPLAEDARVWRDIERNESCGVLQSFIGRFPASVYADFAKARRAELRCDAAALVEPDRQPWFPWIGGGAAKPPEETPPVEAKPEPVKPAAKPAGPVAVAAPVTPPAPQPGPARPAAGVSPPACGGVLVAVGEPGRGEERCIKPGSGESFKDCPDCPEMVVAPAGRFQMGSSADEIAKLTKEYGDYFKNEGPQREVRIPAPFAVGKFEVTFAEWDACVAAGGCRHKPETEWGRGRQPVMRVLWDDITKEYLPWLSKKTGKAYRLLSEAEWEYAARAGTQGPFSFSGKISADKANYDANFQYDGSAKGKYREKTVEAGSLPANPWGLHEVHGNVWEWVEDCYVDSYKDAPPDGSPRKTTGTCTSRVLRGSSWFIDPRFLRAANRFRFRPDFRFSDIGFRLARTL